MNEIQSAAAPVLEQTTKNGKKQSENKNSSPSPSAPDMFQWLLASLNTSPTQSREELTSDASEDEKNSETGQTNDHKTMYSFNLSWLQQLLNGQIGSDNQSFVSINAASGSTTQADTAKVDNNQSEPEQSQSASAKLQAITEQALAILKTLVNAAPTDGLSIGLNQQAASMSDDRQIEQMAQKLLQLLKQRGQIIKQVKSSFKGIEQNLQSSRQGQSTQNSQESALWKALSSAFDKRNQLTAKHHYNSESTVSNQDVLKWIKQALQRNESMQYKDSSSQQKVSFNTGSGSMSKVEQYVIHVPQNTSHQAPDKALLDQFQKAIQSSRLFGHKDNVTRMNFSLRPEGLGDMTVKLAKVEGEMTVKIMVSSTTAQDMMEKNIHQLKHMFSPNHVSIERQDNQFNQTQDINSQQEDEQDQHQDGGDETDQSDEHDQEENDSEDFQEELDDLLNEKA